MSEEQTSKLKNILHHLYNILCYVVYITFTIFMGLIFCRSIIVICQYITFIPKYKHMSSYYLSTIIAHTPIVICSAMCIYKSIKAMVNKTFSLYRIIIISLIILSFSILVETFFHSCPCSTSQTFSMLIITLLLIPLVMTINRLIKKRKNITSTFKIFINKISIGILLTISVLLIAIFIILANTNPHKMSNNAIVYDSFDTLNTKTSNSIPSIQKNEE